MLFTEQLAKISSLKPIDIKKSDMISLTYSQDLNFQYVLTSICSQSMNFQTRENQEQIDLENGIQIGQGARNEQKYKACPCCLALVNIYYQKQHNEECEQLIKHFWFTKNNQQKRSFFNERIRQVQQNKISLCNQLRNTQFGVSSRVRVLIRKIQKMQNLISDLENQLGKIPFK